MQGQQLSEGVAIGDAKTEIGRDRNRDRDSERPGKRVDILVRAACCMLQVGDASAQLSIAYNSEVKSELSEQ